MNDQYSTLMRIFTVFCFLSSMLFITPVFAQGTLDLETYKEKGEQLLQEKEPWRALSHYQKALEAYPGDIDLLVGAGKAAWLSGDASEAVNHLYGAVQAAPDHYEANLLLGKALARQADEMIADPIRQSDGYMMIEDALNFLRKSVNLNHESAEAPLILATTLYGLSDLEGADAAAAEALNRKPDAVDALLLRGDVAYTAYTQGSGENMDASALNELWRKAVDFYKKAVNLDPAQDRAYVGLGGLYEWEKKWNQASEAYLTAVHLNPENTQAYERLLIIYGMDGFTGKLSDELAALLQDDETKKQADSERSATAEYYLGRAYLQEGDYEKSIAAFENSITLNEQFRTCVSYYMSRAAYGAEDLDKAAQVLVDTVNSDPEGLIYYMQNDFEFMSRFYVPMKFIAFHLVQANRLEDARNLNGILISLVPNDPGLCNDYGLLCRDTGQYEEAFSAYEKAVELDPKNPNYLNDCALILHYHLHRDLDRAEAMYNQAIEEAGKILQDTSGLDEATVETIQTALRDATNNKALLKAGHIEPEG
ncbi:MAG: tetratricopeptide repeat protein [Planctomycetes bacterium]|nr:tetratricopeptide repeat protein [Planctomycetota bacterium]